MLTGRVLGKVLRRTSAAVSPSCVSVRHLCDSHDDFKPKKKSGAEPAGMDDAIALIEKQVKEHDVMLYMKGTPDRPQCGFSMQAVRILNAIGVEFSSGEFRCLFHPLHSSFNLFLIIIILLFFTWVA